MRYRNKPELQDKLAAEYVLGTLRGRARLRFQAWMREDAALRRAVWQWESRLAPMAAGVAEVRPPRRVWHAVDSRIAGGDVARAKPGFWESVAFWRGWGLIATGCAVALLPAPQGGGDKQVFIAYVPRDSDELWVRRVALDPEPAGRGYELWGLPAKAGEPPKSLGMLPRDERGTIKLAAAADQSLRDFPALAISIEPEGGSKTGLPTGPVIAKGDTFQVF